MIYSNGERFNPYREVLEEFTKLFLLEQHHGKRRTILCYGAPNSGKSKFINAFKEIFQAFEYRSTASKFALAMKQRDKNPSLIVSDEFKKSNFDPSNIDNMKQLLEGNGGIVEHKGVDPITAYQGANFFLCCQYVHPLLLKKREDATSEEWYNKTAMIARIKLFEFKVSHGFSVRNPFPLDAKKIAVLLKYFVSIANSEM